MEFYYCIDLDRCLKGSSDFVFIIVNVNVELNINKVVIKFN